MPYALLWLRYSTFVILYPLGVASEISPTAPAASAARQVSVPREWDFNAAEMSPGPPFT